MAKRRHRGRDLEDQELDDEALDELYEEEEEEDDDNLDDDDDLDEDGDDDEDDDTDLLLADEDATDGLEAGSVFEQAPGYSDTYDWGQLSEAERERHEEILAMDLDELAKLRLSKLSVLDRWAAALAFFRLGDRDAYQDACRSILRARTRHDGLLYEDVYLELISELTETKQHEEAFGYLDRFAKAFPEEETVYQRVRGLLMIDAGQVDEGKTLLNALSSGRGADGEELLEIGDDLVALGHPELALVFLKRGKQQARRREDPEMITALDATIRVAQEQLEAEE